MRIFLFFIIVILSSCSREHQPAISDSQNKSKEKSRKLEHIPHSIQRSGDPIKGKEYLLEGDYLDSGIPLVMMEEMGLAPKMEDVLGRKGKNANLPPIFTATKAKNGVEILAPNCLVCHGGYLNDEYIVGLGNYDFNGTTKNDFALNSMAFMVEKKYTKESDEWSAFEQFYKSTTALSGNTQTESVGANSADKITEVLLAHRKMPNMEWSEEPLMEISEETIPADPPAWWLLKKKNAQFTTGIGRGDFARISTASSLLTMDDISKAKEIDDKFVDIIAYINTLKAPEYPGDINQTLANKGELIFNKTCSTCHGKYGGEPTFPNYVVHKDVVKTDPALADSYYDRKRFVDMYNESWFGQGEYAARIVPTAGYVAPPLDGVWATSPYLHNGSVPTIAALLESSERPTYWKRSLSPKDYDLENLGWQYQELDSKVDARTYDTTLDGYGNQGHYFGDKLSSEEREAVIEYLKTL